MREISHSNVKFISADLLERVTCINMMHKFMKNISRSNLIFVATPVLNCATRANMLNLFMKEVSHSNVKFVSTVSFSPFLFLVTFGDEVTKIRKYYVIFFYIRKENHLTKVTKIPKTTRRKLSFAFPFWFL